MPFFFILYSTPLQKKHARAARDSTICAKNNTFGYFDGTNLIAGSWREHPVAVSYSDYGPGYIFKKNTALSRG